MRTLRADGSLPSDRKLRSSKYLNNLIERDRQGAKHRIAVTLGRDAITIAGIELMIRLGRLGARKVELRQLSGTL